MKGGKKERTQQIGRRRRRRSRYILYVGWEERRKTHSRYHY